MNRTHHTGSNKLLLGIVLSVITYWLFAQSIVNIVPTLQRDLGISLSLLNIGISLTALFSGIFIVVGGELADHIGRVKITKIGLYLSILGSLLVGSSFSTPLFLIGRIIQGLSAALIMPATLALIKAYYQDKDRQRALSFWSIGSWGGSGISSFVAGAITASIGWRWIFGISIFMAIVGLLLIHGTPESRTVSSKSSHYDILGILAFIISLLALNLLITKGGQFGYLSAITLSILTVFIIGTWLFVKLETHKKDHFFDFSLFKSRNYTGATISNFLLNAVAGTLAVGSLYLQQGLKLSAFQAGLLTLGYLVAILSTIRVGEKLLQRLGAKRPMVLGSLIAAVGVALMGATFLAEHLFLIFYFTGFILMGVGLGIYATPSTDTAIAAVPSSKVGEASGIYKMASSLGGSFGVAISLAVYTFFKNAVGVQTAGMMSIWANAAFGFLSFIAIAVLIPNMNHAQSTTSEMDIVSR